MKYLILFFSLFLIIGCTESLEEQTSRLVNAKKVWFETENNLNYEFKYKRYCFCVFNGQEIIIKVQDNEIVSAKTDGKEISTKSFLTINGYFKQILGLLKREETESNLEVNVEYDSNYGFPAKISIKTHGVFDASSTQFLSNLKLK